MCAQPTSDLLLVHSAINTLDTFSLPVKYFSWYNRDTLARHQEFYLKHSDLQFRKISGDSIFRQLEVIWVYFDSTNGTLIDFPSMCYDSISGTQFRALKPKYFKTQLQFDSPNIFGKYILPGAALLAGVLLISGMFYFRTRS